MTEQPERADPIGAEEDLCEWFRRHIPGSPIARNTVAHNRIFTAVAEIKSALASVIKE